MKLPVLPKLVALATFLVLNSAISKTKIYIFDLTNRPITISVNTTPTLCAQRARSAHKTK